MPLRQGVQYKKVIEGPWEIKPPKIKRGYRYAIVLLGCGHATLVIINNAAAGRLSKTVPPPDLKAIVARVLGETK